MARPRALVTAPLRGDALEELHRKFHMSGVAAFEAVVKDGTAVLQTLTTISKRVIRHLRDRSQEAHGAAAAAPADGSAWLPADRMSDARHVAYIALVFSAAIALRVLLWGLCARRATPRALRQFRRLSSAHELRTHLGV